MGEQPNPWEVLPPQDATSRHRAISVVTDGADYLSTLLLRARGRRLMTLIDCFFEAERHLTALRRISRYRVMSRELVEHLWQHVWPRDFLEPFDAFDRDPNAVVRLVTIQCRSNRPLRCQ